MTTTEVAEVGVGARVYSTGRGQFGEVVDDESGDRVWVQWIEAPSGTYMKGARTCVPRERIHVARASNLDEYGHVLIAEDMLHVQSGLIEGVHPDEVVAWVAKETEELESNFREAGFGGVLMDVGETRMKWEGWIAEPSINCCATPDVMTLPRGTFKQGA